MQSVATDLRSLSSLPVPVYLWFALAIANSSSTTDILTDAVPKKRGPKTDVLEALLKRVDGLERRLKDEKKSHSPNNEGESISLEESVNGDSKSKRPQLDTTNIADESAIYSPTPPRRVALI